MKRWFHRVGKKCFGVTLWRRPHVELWVCFDGVGEHRHPGQRVEVYPLFGWATFYRRRPDEWLQNSYGEDVARVRHRTERIEIRAKSWWHGFTVPAGWPHWFLPGTLLVPLVFVNVTSDGRSAAENFEPSRLGQD